MLGKRSPFLSITHLQQAPPTLAPCSPPLQPAIPTFPPAPALASQPSSSPKCVATAAGEKGGSTHTPNHPPQHTSQQTSADASLTPHTQAAADDVGALKQVSSTKQTIEALETPSANLLESSIAGEAASSAIEAPTHTVAAVAAATFLAVAPAVVLDAAALRAVARGNQDSVLQALAAASAAGTPPEIRALLAEPSWKAALSGVLGGSKTRSLQVCGFGRVGGCDDNA